MASVVRGRTGLMIGQLEASGWPEILSLHQRPVAVLLRDHSHRQRPLNADGWIVEANPMRRTRGVVFRGHVVHLAMPLERLATMSAATRHKQHAAIGRGQLDAIPLAIGR